MNIILKSGLVLVDTWVYSSYNNRGTQAIPFVFCEICLISRGCFSIGGNNGFGLGATFVSCALPRATGITSDIQPDEIFAFLFLILTIAETEGAHFLTQPFSSHEPI